MSQAALNTRNSEEEVSSRRNNGTRLAGILFLLTVLTTVLVSGWVVLGWMEDEQRLPLSKLVMMMPVKVAESISSISQGMRERQVSSTPVFR